MKIREVPEKSQLGGDGDQNGARGVAETQRKDHEISKQRCTGKLQRVKAYVRTILTFRAWKGKIYVNKVHV